MITKPHIGLFGWFFFWFFERKFWENKFKVNVLKNIIPYKENILKKVSIFHCNFRKGNMKEKILKKVTQTLL